MKKFRCCLVDGCKGNSFWTSGGAKGYCRAHYKKFLKYGDPSVSRQAAAGEPMAWIIANKNYAGDDCLIWPFAKGEKGGAIIVDGIHHVSSRVMCEIVNGPPLTKKHHAAHSCGNGHLACMSPKHLDWKTAKENQADRISHGTMHYGEKHGNAKLTNEKVLEIRKLSSELSIKELASRFNMGTSAINGVVTRFTWSHI